MKALILHQHFNSPVNGGPLRSYYLARALVEKGWEPVVITAHQERKYKKELLDGIAVHYLPIAYENRFGFWKRGTSFLQFAWSAYRLARTIPGIDICYAISVPLTVGLTAQQLKSRHQIPYVFEVGDLWPDAPIEMGFIRSYIFKEYLYNLERSVYSGAEAIVALSSSIRTAIEKKTINGNIHVIENMSDTDFYRPEKKNPELERKFDVAGNFVVSYIGAVGVANGLEFFLESARASQTDGLNVRFLLCGDGALLAEHKRNAKKLNLTNLKFIPFQNRDGVREVMNVTDAVFVCYKPYPILETGSPNKYFDGLAAGKLIIVNFGGWIRDEIESVRCGVYIERKNPNDFVRQLQPFLADATRLSQAQHASRHLAVTKYARKILAGRFGEVLQQFRGGR